MAIKIRNILKSFFTTGAKPTQSQFADFIDSFVHKTEEVDQPGGVPSLGLDGKIPAALLNLLAYAKRITTITQVNASKTLSAVDNDTVQFYRGAPAIVITLDALGEGFGCVYVTTGGKTSFAAAGGITIINEENKFAITKPRPVSIVYLSNTEVLITGTNL